MQPARPFRYPKTREDLETLRELLQMGTQASGWKTTTAPTILTLACGRADETGVLAQTLVPRGGACFIFGLDLRPVEIAEARERWIPAAGPDQHVDFRVGNAAQLDRLGELPAFDFIFVRHQNFWHAPQVWTEIFRQALLHLKHGGQLAITSYFDREHALAKACLAQLEAEVVADFPNPRSRPLPDAHGKSVDRHLAFFRQSP
jgi:SAM-dependent methyltransferase